MRPLPPGRWRGEILACHMVASWFGDVLKTIK